MEDNTPKPSEDSATPGPIHDVQVAPAPPEEVESEQKDSLIPEVQAAGDPSVNEQPPVPPAEPAHDQPENSGAETPDQPPAQPEHVDHHKPGGPIAAVVAAVFVAIGLAVVTVYAYMKTQQDQKPATSQTAEDTSANEAAETNQELDQTSKEIDDAIQTSEEADFPEEELSDQNLNL